MKLYNCNGDPCENVVDAQYIIGTRQEIEEYEVDWAYYSHNDNKEHLWEQTADTGHRWEVLNSALLNIIQWQQYNQ